MKDLEKTFIEDKIPKKAFFAKRDILWYFVFLGFAVNYMIRVNLNIAIVSMVKAKPKHSGSSHIGECYKNQDLADRSETDDNDIHFISNTTILNETLLNTSSLLQHGDLNLTTYHHDPDSGEFEWDEHVQGLILGCFFWIHWATQLPGGLLATVYGTKLVFGLSNFMGIIINFAVPYAANLGANYLIALRMVQGILTGFAWPAMHTMTAKWIPPNERSKFVTAYLGSSVGAAVTFPMCGYIIALWGWEYVFYASGLLGTIWFICWWLFVFDSPNEHPTITDEERDYIISSLGHSVSKEKEPVPWRAILTSVPMWMNILAQWGGIWGLFTLMTHAPTYIKFIHGMNIQATGIIAGIPHVLRMVWAYVFSLLGDYWLRTEAMSRTNVRKVATAVCCGGQGVFMLLLAYSGCNYTSAIIYMTFATAIHGAVSTGPLASFVDLSPNHAGVQLGLSGMISVMPGFLSPIIVSYLTFNNQTVDQWQKVFWIATAWLIGSAILYVVFGRSDLQSWNAPHRKDGQASNGLLETELKVLNGKEEDEHDDGDLKKESGLLHPTWKSNFIMETNHQTINGDLSTETTKTVCDIKTEKEI